MLVYGEKMTILPLWEMNMGNMNNKTLKKTNVNIKALTKENENIMALTKAICGRNYFESIWL